ncbi:hypothetical protein [Desulfobacula sp.]|uniref:DUF6812 domain-containing protein n=1 Tax=Desulfobacula sp. TaxID=2593537 RepID=UPI00345CDF0A
MNINRNAGFDRVSDLVLSKQELFLVLIDANVYEVGIENPVKHKTLFVNKNHIIWASLDESQNSDGLFKMTENLFVWI